MAKQDWKMEYASPAEMWEEAIPLGNGRLGAMAYGHIGIERIQLNEDTLWSSGPMERNNPASLEKLPEIRQLILQGKVKEAEELMAQYMFAAPYSMPHYEPLGELDIAMGVHTPFVSSWTPQSPEMDSYKGSLDLMRGVYTVTHSKDGVNYTREMFASFPAQVICLRLRADKPGALDLDIQMDRMKYSDSKSADDRRPGKVVRGGGWSAVLLQENRTYGGDTIVISGSTAGVGYAGAAKVVCDGQLLDPTSQLLVRGATEVCIYMAGSTTNREQDPKATVLNLVEKAAQRGFEALLEEHIADFEPKMRACTLDLGDEPNALLEQRMKDFREGGEDPALAALYFTFGRYLILSGSRVGSAALNLQGIWNQDFTPSWDSKYTININLQMNYWPAEEAALSQETDPLWDLLEIMCQKGKETARVMYGCRGSVCHHNTDIYGDCAPQDAYMAATIWPTGGAWTALHLWDHYQFTQDKDFLRKWYPVMREYALFFVDYLIDDGTGKLVTCPSVSPENRYILPDGFDTPVCAGPAMDNQILRALFDACLQSVEILELDEPLTEDFRRCAEKLPENKIGSNGQLLEWREEVPELTPGMGHISHLWGAYPGDEINWKDTPDLWEAVRRSLDIRVENGAGDHGWPAAWYICQYARLLDPVKTESFIRTLLAQSAKKNFFNARGVFQIDGNLGGLAGMAEALLQSHLGMLHLLPALPPAWKQGSVQGMKARGGYTVDIAWKDGKLTEATVSATKDGTLEVYGEELTVICNGQQLPVQKTAHGFSFPVKEGCTYQLCAN